MKTFVLAGDANYTVPIETMIKSILYHHQGVKIYILHQDIPKGWIELVKRLAESLGSDIEDIRLSDDVVSTKWITLGHISPIAFARYWIPEYIQEDRVVYLDSDMVVHQPLDELFEIDLQGYLLAAVRDANGQGFNSGMMVIDSIRWRKEKLAEQLIQRTVEEMASEQPLTGDQEVLNAVIQDQWMDLEQTYNLQVGHDTYAFYGNWSAHFQDKSVPKVVHYTTANKPWNSTIGYRYRDLWFEYQGLTMGQIQQHYEGRYDVQRVYHHYEVNVFTFTDSQDFLYMEELAQALPNVAFHIGAWTQMGERLMTLQKYPNVYLYPEIVGDVIDELVEYCDGYLDIHFGGPQEWIVKRFVEQRKKCLTFDRTSKNSESEIVVNAESAEGMIQAIRQLSEPLISVIVPIYNVENYLEDCVNSILNQTYQNIEVILVNDGSPDNSAAICQAFEQQDNRVRYIEKENSGVADARNIGIEYAIGTYIFFVDSDDWIEWNSLEILVDAMRRYKSKMVVASYTRYEEAEGLFYRHIYDEQYYEKDYSKKELLEKLPLLEAYDITYQTCWGILYNYSLFIDIRFPSGRLNEDIGTMFKLFLLVDKILYLNLSLYNYRIRENSYTTLGLSEKKMQDDLELRQERIAILALNNYDISAYCNQQKTYLEQWYRGAVESNIGQTEIARRFKENRLLLGTREKNNSILY